MVRRSTPRTADRFLAAVAVASFLLFVGLAVLIRSDWAPVIDLDHRVARDLHVVALDQPGQLRVWRDVSTVFAPGDWRIALAVLVVVLALWRHAVRDAVLLAVAVLGTLFLSPLAKVIVDRDRPRFANPVAHAAGQSYPSGHALTSFVGVAALAAVCSPAPRRYVLAVGALVVAAVGFSRLILGVHYLSDVVGGWLLGLAWIGLVVLVFSSSRVRGFRAGRWRRSPRRRQLR